MLHTSFDKIKFLERVNTEYAFLERTLALVPTERITEAGVCGHWSVKDLVAHLTAWERLTLRWLDDAARGMPLKVPDEGFDWEDFDVQNDLYHQRTKDHSLEDILADARRVRAEILALIDGLTDEELAGGGRFAGMFIDSPRDAIASNTCEHYEQHVTQIREWLNRVVNV